MLTFDPSCNCVTSILIQSSKLNGRKNAVLHTPLIPWLEIELEKVVVVISNNNVYNYNKNLDCLIHARPTIIPKSTKGLENQPKKINQKKSKQNHLYLCPLLHNYATFTLDWRINPKKSTKKIKIKSPLSMPLTTQLCNFYIGLENQPKKINQKKSK